MKMKGQLNVKTSAEYIAAVDDKRRSDIAALDALIRKHAPKLEPVIMGGTWLGNRFVRMSDACCDSTPGTRKLSLNSPPTLPCSVMTAMAATSHTPSTLNG